MNRSHNMKRIFLLLLLAFAALSIFAGISTFQKDQNNSVTFATVFQTVGKAPQALSRATTKVIPVDGFDEGELGQKLKDTYPSSELNTPELKRSSEYLNALIKKIQVFKKKPFNYEVKIMHTEVPNAMALPGGLIIVTTGLMKTLKSESELVSVLGHEMGHIELSHCLDSVKYKLLTEKVIKSNLGEFADFAQSLLLRHSFSKTQEDEADQYGFQVLVETQYDPTGMAKAFKNLKKSYRGVSLQGNPFRDYIISHPPIEQRVAKFSSEAAKWWGQQTNERRYVGEKNLQLLDDLATEDYGEWVSRFEISD